MSIQDMLAREFGTIPELIHAHAQQRPAHLALIEGERSLDFASLDASMDRFAASLSREGLQAGDIIAICASSSIEYAVAFLGAIRIGVAVAPLAPSSTAESLASMLNDCGAQWLFLDAASARTLEAVRASLRVTCVALDGDEQIGVPWDKWLAPPGAHPKPVEVAPDGPFNVIYSSGTTGTPKGIVQPHRMRWAHVHRAESAGYGPNAVVLISTPLYSNTTLVSFFPCVALGGTAVLLAKFEAKKFLEASARHRATHAMLVPVQYQRIMDHPEFDRFDLSSYRMKFCTSAPFAAALKARVLEKWPGGLIEYYGMTEGGGTCVLIAHMFPQKLHTVGCPVPGHDIRLIDENGKQVATGEAGEVVGASPAASMTGYHNQPSKTSEAEWYDETGKRFIRTGDIGRFDEDGFLTLIDRKKDMIISGGFNIYPSDLEAVLIQHPAIEEAAVVGVPSKRWGESPVAFAVRKPGHAAVSGEDVSAWFEHRVGKTQRLAALEWVDALPRSPIGKVLKRELRAEYLKRSAS
ncbi:MAG TPA: class I adenylate-forming enzyme family protein [Polyangiales bacterium]|jgi:acyl-CoA synthetase (AMP-forming)/AMP-acid ligase II